ncbi:MAG: hypothetical protein HY905_18950 [Deltaproteobacteria bacterium]|nr:hypothetical protein [Deltaproteobacteria bacterium]
MVNRTLALPAAVLVALGGLSACGRASRNERQGLPAESTVARAPSPDGRWVLESSLHDGTLIRLAVRPAGEAGLADRVDTHESGAMKWVAGWIDETRYAFWGADTGTQWVRAFDGRAWSELPMAGADCRPLERLFEAKYGERRGNCLRPDRAGDGGDSRSPQAGPSPSTGGGSPLAGSERTGLPCETLASLSVDGVLDCIGSDSLWNDERRLAAVRHIAEIAARTGDGEEREGLREAIFVTGPAVRKAVRDALVSLGEVDAAFAAALPEPGEFVRAANALLEAAESPMTKVVADSCRLRAAYLEPATRIECRDPSNPYVETEPSLVAILAWHEGSLVLERTEALPFWRRGSLAETMWNDRVRACRDALAAARRESSEAPALFGCVDSTPSPLSMEEQLELISAAVRAAAGTERERAVAGLLGIAMTEDAQIRPAVLEALGASGALSPEAVALVPTWSEADVRILELLHGRVPENAQLPSSVACNFSADSSVGPLRLQFSGGHCLDGPGCVSAEFTIRASGWKLERLEVFEAW